MSHLMGHGKGYSPSPCIPKTSGVARIHLQTLPVAATSVTRARPAIPTMDGLASSAVSRG